MLLLALSLWFAHPAPLDMPRAEAFLVKEEGVRRLEDRFDERELWVNQAVLGRWEDDDGRFFTLSKLDVLPPLASDAVTKTRTDYKTYRVAVDKKDDGARDQAVARLSPLPLPDKPQRPAQGFHGLKETLYYHGTNTSHLVCAFLPEKSDAWYLAVWQLLPEDDFAYSKELFEADFLMKWETHFKEQLRSEQHLFVKDAPKKHKKEKVLPPERDLLRADACHSVTNYTGWHVTHGDEFVVLDDIPAVNRFVVSLTNDMKVLRKRYNEVLPSPLDGTNVLCVARIFKDRDEYLDVVGDDMKWVAAYWSPSRREIVAYLPEGGADDLLKTLRHEAFHQYLSYACAMLTAAPWLNEGYAQYFEDEDSLDWEIEGVNWDWEVLATYLPDLLQMDYEAFYAGSDLERRLKYRLAWSIAVFLEKGAPNVRFQPFAKVKKDYLEALLKTRDRAQATASVFHSSDFLKLFVQEWRKFWEEL